MLKNAETYAELRDSAVESAAKPLVHVGGVWGRRTHQYMCPPYSTTVGQCMHLSLERICTEKKIYSRETEGGKSYGMGINSA